MSKGGIAAGVVALLIGLGVGSFSRTDFGSNNMLAESFAAVSP